MLRLGILGSTRGTNLIALQEAIQNNKLQASIELVLSNKPDAGILQLAKNFNLAQQFLDPATETRENYDKKMSAILKAKKIDFIILVGYMRILSASFVAEWHHKIMNVHPSLLPDFAGGMDKQVHEAVIKSGIKETGCTVHFVTEQVDAGPILLQRRCEVKTDDTIESLKQRVQALEGDALIEAINHYIKFEKTT